MIAFSKIKPGMTLWDVRKADWRSRIGGRSKWSTWHVKVIEVDEEKRRVLASWNYNKPDWMSERNITRYRAKKPSDIANVASDLSRHE